MSYLKCLEAKILQTKINLKLDRFFAWQKQVKVFQLVGLKSSSQPYRMIISNTKNKEAILKLEYVNKTAH